MKSLFPFGLLVHEDGDPTCGTCPSFIPWDGITAAHCKRASKFTVTHPWAWACPYHPLFKVKTNAKR